MSQRTPSHALRDRAELGEHRLREAAVAVVELERVGPAGEVRVAAVGEDAARRRRARRQFVGFAAQVVLGALR